MTIRRRPRAFEPSWSVRVNTPSFRLGGRPDTLLAGEHTFTHLIWELMEAIADDRLPQPNFEDGVRNQRVLDAIERSARDGTRRRVPS